MYGTLRTWAAWTVGRIAEKTEDLADALHFVADFLEYEVGGIEALRTDWTGPFADFARSLNLEPWTPNGDKITGVLVSNEEPTVNVPLQDQKRMAELRENEGRAIDYGSGSVNGIGWPMPGDSYDEGNGHWYQSQPLGAPDADPVGDLQRMFVAVDAAPYPPREQVLRLRFVKRDDGAYDLETDFVDADDGETGMEDADS